MSTDLTPVLAATSRRVPRQPPSGAGIVNLFLGLLVAFGTGAVLVQVAVDGDVSGWLVTGIVDVLVFAVAQVMGELVLARSVRWSVRRAVAAVVGVTGAVAALTFLAQGHDISSTCDSYCSTDVATGRRTEVIAVGIAGYAVLTTVQLVRRDGRSPRLETAVGVLAPGLVLAYAVATVFGSH